MFSPSVTAEGEVNSLGVGDMLSSSAKPHSLYIYIYREVYITVHIYCVLMCNFLKRTAFPANSNKQA